MDRITKFSKKELIKYDGKNGKPAFIAFKGKVYNVSDSYFWKDGTHQVLHNAGVDLTKMMEQAPHGADLLEKFQIVGTLRNTSSPKSRPGR